MPTRRSHPYSIRRRRSRAGAARRDLLREAAANWGAGDCDSAGQGPEQAGNETTLHATAEGALHATVEERSLDNLIEVYGQAGAEDDSAPAGRPATPARYAQPVPIPKAGRRDGRRPVISFHPGQETVEAIMRAAAIIACADGQVTPIERHSLLSFLGRHGILARDGRAASAAAFDKAVREAAVLRLDEACAAAESLRCIAGRPGASMVANAAAVVALADGIGWPQELALLEVIRDRLGLRTGHQAGSAMA